MRWQTGLLSVVLALASYSVVAAAPLPPPYVEGRESPLLTREYYLPEATKTGLDAPTVPGNRSVDPVASGSVDLLNWLQELMQLMTKRIP